MSNPNGQLKNNLNTMTVRIDTNLSGKEYYFVNFDTTDDYVVNLAADQSLPCFILEEGADGSSAEKVGTIALPGSVTKVKLAEAAAAGKFLVPTAAGEAEVADAAGERYGAVALENGTTGDIIRVLCVLGEVEASDA